MYAILAHEVLELAEVERRAPVRVHLAEVLEEGALAELEASEQLLRYLGRQTVFALGAVQHQFADLQQK